MLIHDIPKMAWTTRQLEEAETDAQGAASIADANDAHAKQSQAGYNNYDTADDCGWNGSLAQTKILRR